jgi:hypothetical protein
VPRLFSKTSRTHSGFRRQHDGFAAIRRSTTALQRSAAVGRTKPRCEDALGASDTWPRVDTSAHQRCTTRPHDSLPRTWSRRISPRRRSKVAVLGFLPSLNRARQMSKLPSNLRWGGRCGFRDVATHKWPAASRRPSGCAEGRRDASIRRSPTPDRRPVRCVDARRSGPHGSEFRAGAQSRSVVPRRKRSPIARTLQIVIASKVMAVRTFAIVAAP